MCPSLWKNTATVQLLVVEVLPGNTPLVWSAGGGTGSSGTLVDLGAATVVAKALPISFKWVTGPIDPF